MRVNDFLKIWNHWTKERWYNLNHYTLCVSFGVNLHFLWKMFVLVHSNYFLFNKESYLKDMWSPCSSSWLMSDSTMNNKQISLNIYTELFLIKRFHNLVSSELCDYVVHYFLFQRLLYNKYHTKINWIFF